MRLRLVTALGSRVQSGQAPGCRTDRGHRRFPGAGQISGNDAGFIGGSLSFDLQDTVPSDGVPYPAVVLYSSLGFSISYTASPPGTSWTSYSIPLTASGWTGYPGGEQNGVVPVTDAEFGFVMASIAKYCHRSGLAHRRRQYGTRQCRSGLWRNSRDPRALDLGDDGHGFGRDGLPIGSREARRSRAARAGVSARYSLRLTDEAAEGLAVSSSHFSSRV